MMPAARAPEEFPADDDRDRPAAPVRNGCSGGSAGNKDVGGAAGGKGGSDGKGEGGGGEVGGVGDDGGGVMGGGGEGDGGGGGGKIGDGDNMNDGCPGDEGRGNRGGGDSGDDSGKRGKAGGKVGKLDGGDAGTARTRAEVLTSNTVTASPSREEIADSKLDAETALKISEEVRFEPPGSSEYSTCVSLSTGLMISCSSVGATESNMTKALMTLSAVGSTNSLALRRVVPISE